MNRLGVATILGVGLVASAAAGWLAHDVAADQRCRYTAHGYSRLEGDLNRLSSFPLEKVPEAVVGDIQKCWAAHPYLGPEQSLQMIGAVKAPSGGYFVVFDPWNLTDTQIVFLVDERGSVRRAFAYSTL